MSSFLSNKLAQRLPYLSPAGLEKEHAIIFYNVKLHGTETLHRIFTECFAIVLNKKDALT